MPRAKKPTHYVYFIRAGINGPIKIGKAVDIKKRIDQMQTGNHLDLILVGKIPFDSESMALSIERHLHYILRDKRIRGEWFHGDISINKALRKTELKKEYESTVTWNDFHHAHIHELSEDVIAHMNEICKF